MNTSYYANMRRLPKDSNFVSIAGFAPDWYKGRQYKILAPKLWFFKQFKEDKNVKKYIAIYYKEVLAKLDPQKVLQDLGNDAILLCYEVPQRFCHRHVVAAWLNKKLDLGVKEIGEEQIRSFVETSKMPY